MQFKKPLFWDYKKPNLISNIFLFLTIPLKISNFLLDRKKIKKIARLKLFVLEIYTWEELVKLQLPFLCTAY